MDQRNDQPGRRAGDHAAQACEILASSRPQRALPGSLVWGPWLGLLAALIVRGLT